MDLRQALGVEHPAIQAPMAGVQGSALAIAVCQAGGLGSLPCAMLDAIRAGPGRLPFDAAAAELVEGAARTPAAASRCPRQT